MWLIDRASKKAASAVVTVFFLPVDLVADLTATAIQEAGKAAASAGPHSSD